MRQRFRNIGHLPLARLASVVVIAAFAGACSSDVLRLADNPFSNPFAGGARTDAAATGSLNGAPAPRVQSSALSAPKSPNYQPLPGNVGATGQIPKATSAATSVASKAAPVLGSAAGWTSNGGSPITLSQGDTVEALSGRYGVPVAALRQVNGLSGNAQPSPGQQFIIPAFNPGSKASPAPAAAAPSAPRYESVASNTQRQSGSDDEDEETKAAPKKLPTTGIKAVDRKAAPVNNTVAKAASAKDKAKTVVAKAQPTQKSKPATEVKKSAEDDEDDDAPVQTAKQPAKVETKAEVKKQPEAPKTAKVATKSEEPSTTGSLSEAKDGPEFRWPARGRVISGYGAKSPSGANDGINIAVPEGTPVKATEGGTVAYAGEEIKGYGKMVLIRHPNGYVSAYAHNGDLNVKRGEAVKRGQVIAKSGQTGNVTSPQLHFELRKGSEPVDPSKYLE